MPHRYHLFDSAFGRCAIAWNDNGLTRTRLPDRDARQTEHSVAGNDGARVDADLPEIAKRAVAELCAYFDGHTSDLDSLPLDFSIVAEFNARIYRALRAVPRGETTTYGALARAVEAPGAARAVGMAMGRNPWPVIVPCHRVLAAGAKMGGFSAPGGTLTKERLLALEGVAVGGTPMLPGLRLDQA